MTATDTTAAARAEFFAYATEIGSTPIAEEHAILNAGREFLPACALAVLDGAEPTADYWAFLLAQTAEAQAEHDSEIKAGHEWHA